MGERGTVASGALIGGLATIVVSLGLIAWTFGTRLRYEAAIIPRLSLAVIACGGLLLVVKALRSAQVQAEARASWDDAGVAAVVLAVMVAFGLLFLKLGMMTAIFVTLSLVWLLLGRRLGRDRPAALRSWRLFATALATGTVLYLMFVRFLGVYLPDTLLV